jgi:hypothetical protein
MARQFLVGFLSLLILSTVVFGEDAKQVFNELFGDEVRKVNRTSGKDDDVALAKTLLIAAEAEAESVGVVEDKKPAMLELLCEQVYTLASRSTSGYEIARKALMLLAEKVPAAKSKADQRITLLFQRAYERSRGEERVSAGKAYLGHLLSVAQAQIQDKRYASVLITLRKAMPVASATKSVQVESIKAASEYYSVLSQASRRADLLEKKVVSNAWDKTVRSQLVTLYVKDLDDPVSAAKHLALGGDATQKKLVPLATKALAEINEKQASELGSWYRSMSGSGTRPAKTAMLARAKLYFDHFLSLHITEDLHRTAATVKLTDVNTQLAKLPAVPKLSPGEGDTAEADDETKWVDATDTFKNTVDNGSYLRLGAEAQAKDGAIHFEGAQKGDAYVVAAIGVENVVFSAKIKKTAGTSALIGVRANGVGNYHVALSGTNNVTMMRWIDRQFRGTQLAQAKTKSTFGRDDVTVMIAVVKNTILFYVNGKRVMKAEDTTLTGDGSIIIGAARADAVFSDLKYFVPSESQMKKMIESK